MAGNPSDGSAKSSPNGAPPKFKHQDVNKLGIASALLKASTFTLSKSRIAPDNPQLPPQQVVPLFLPLKETMARTPTTKTSQSLSSVRTSATSTSPRTATYRAVHPHPYTTNTVKPITSHRQPSPCLAACKHTGSAARMHPRYSSFSTVAASCFPAWPDISYGWTTCGRA